MRKSFHRRIDISFCPQYIRKERRSGDDQAAPDQSRLRVCLLLRLRRGRGGGGRGREDSGQRSEDDTELAAVDENIAIEQSKFISEKDNFEALGGSFKLPPQLSPTLQTPSSSTSDPSRTRNPSSSSRVCYSFFLPSSKLPTESAISLDTLDTYVGRELGIVICGRAKTALILNALRKT